MKKQTNKIKYHASEEAVERKTFAAQTDQKNFRNSLKDSLWEDLLKTSVKQTLPEQLFGTGQYKKYASGELIEGEELLIGTRAVGTDKENKQILRSNELKQILSPNKVEISREHFEYFRSIEGTNASQVQEQRALEKRIEEILIELKRIMQSSKEIQLMFKEVANEDMPIQAGKYHLNFLEIILSMLKRARKAVESGSWLSLFASKKQQRKYWNMFKKHGTTFGLSGERTVSTQTG